MITFRQKGDFSKTTKYFNRLLEVVKMSDFDKYGREGVDALKSATPIDTGKTASSWYYDISHKNGSVIISFKNSNVVDGVPIAIIIQYGHGTRNGGYVQGRDYINPVIRPIFDRMAQNAWEEVTRV